MIGMERAAVEQFGANSSLVHNVRADNPVGNSLGHFEVVFCLPKSGVDVVAVCHFDKI